MTFHCPCRSARSQFRVPPRDAMFAALLDRLGHCHLCFACFPISHRPILDLSHDRFMRPGDVLVKPVLSNAGLHVLAPKPNGPPASKRCIARGEDDLFVGTHAQNFMGKDQRPADELL